MQNFENIIAWRKAMDLAKKAYKFTLKLPDSEKFGLISQIQRCAVSIPSNIAEGSQRGPKEFLRFMDIAFGSLAELKTQTILSSELYEHSVTAEIKYQLLEEANEVGRIMNGLYKSINPLKS